MRIAGRGSARPVQLHTPLQAVEMRACTPPLSLPHSADAAAQDDRSGRADGRSCGRRMDGRSQCAVEWLECGVACVWQYCAVLSR